MGFEDVTIVITAAGQGLALFRLVLFFPLYSIAHGCVGIDAARQIANEALRALGSFAP